MTDFARSEYLVGLLRDLFVAFVIAWFFAKYYPRLVDYRARKSEASAKRRQQKLQQTLDRYEEYVKDVKPFIGLLIREAVLCLTILISMLGFGMMVLCLVTLETIKCHFENNCVEKVGRWPNLSLWFTLPMLIAMVAYIVTERRLRLETSPDMYRFVMQRRIARLDSSG
jgi:hypothetical protein